MTTSQGRRRPAYDTHYEQAKQDLESLAVKLAADGQSRLPAEDQLAEEIGFSRPTVRSALLAMQMEGKVLRLHGVGTFINRHALRVEANLAEDLPFLQVIARLGYEASLDIVRLAEEELPEHIRERAGSPQSGSAIVIDRLFRASGQPAVLSRDYVPTEYLTAPFADLTAERSTFAFLKRWTGHSVRYSVTDIRAIAAPAHVADSLEVAQGSALLVLDHQHIDDQDRAIGVTEAFVKDELIGFSVVRKGTDL